MEGSFDLMSECSPGEIYFAKLAAECGPATRMRQEAHIYDVGSTVTTKVRS